MKSYFLLVFFIILAACNTQKVSIIEEHYKPPLKDTVDYVDYWSKVLYAMPERLNWDSLTPDYRDFAKGMLYLKNGDYDSSQACYLRLFKSPNDTIRNYSRSYLSELFLYRRKFNDWANAFMDTVVSAKVDTIRHSVFIQKRQKEENYFFGSESDTLPIVLNAGLASVIIKVNGEELKFLLDTGCDLSAITKKAAKHFTYQKMDYPVEVISIVGKRVKTDPLIIDSFLLGKTRINNMYATLFENSALRFRFLFITFLKFDGIIGWNVLKNLDFEINYKSKKLVIRKPVNRNITDRNLCWLFGPVIKLTNYMGAELLFKLDIGAMNTSLYPLIFDKMQIPDVVNKKKRIWSVGGSERIKIQRVPNLTLRLNDYLLNFENISSSEDNYYYIRMDGNFGADVGEKGRIRIDALNGRYDIFPELEHE